MSKIGADIQLTYTKQMRQVLSSDYLNSKTLAAIAAEVARETINSNGIAKTSLIMRQGHWKDLHPKYLASKTDKRKFVNTGRVLDAISKPLDNGILSTWGTESDIYARKGRYRKRYRSGGIYAQVATSRDGLSLVVGFNGKARASAALNKARKKMAIDRGADFTGLKSSERRKLINKTVSMADAYGAIKGKSRKYAVPKSTSKSYDNNLFYANYVQSGKKKSNNARPLMPYAPTNTVQIQAAVYRSLNKIFRAIERGR